MELNHATKVLKALCGPVSFNWLKALKTYALNTTTCVRRHRYELMSKNCPPAAEGAGGFVLVCISELRPSSFLA